MKNFLYCVASLFLGVSITTGQEKAEAGDPEKFGRSAWFACTSMPKGLDNPVKLLADDKIIDLELFQYKASEAVKIPEDGILQIVREVSDPADAGKVKYLILAEATIPEGVREALILLVPVNQRDGDKVFNAVVQDLAKFEGGDRMYINMSDSHIRILVGRDKVAVPARQAEIYESPDLDEPQNMPIVYQFYHPEREEWKMLTASTTVVYPTRREICIFNNGSRVGNVKKHSILFPLPVE